MDDNSFSFCAETSSHVAWVGLGGYNESQLMQNGVEQQAGQLDHVWYEALNSTYDTQISPVSGFPISAGQHLTMSTTYPLSSPQYVQFAWHNWATGQVFSLQASAFGGHPVADFYDNGHTAEAVDERITSFGVPTPLSQFSDTAWTKAQVGYGQTSTLTAIRSVPHTGFWMHQTTAPTGDLAKVVGGSTNDSYTDSWLACGHTGF